MQRGCLKLYGLNDLGGFFSKVEIKIRKLYMCVFEQFSQELTEKQFAEAFSKLVVKCAADLQSQVGVELSKANIDPINKLLIEKFKSCVLNFMPSFNKKYS